MSWLRLLIVIVAVSALSACGDDDFNADSGMVVIPQDLSAAVDSGVDL
jgi:hypothetical protein